MSIESPAADDRSAEQQLLDRLRRCRDEPRSGLSITGSDHALVVRLSEGAAVCLESTIEGADDPAVRIPTDAQSKLSVPTLGGDKKLLLAAFSQIAALKDHQVRVELWLAAGACGFASFELAGFRIHWETRPKIEGTDWIGLLAMANGWPAVAIGAEADHDHAEESLVEVLVRAYIGAVERLLHINPGATPMVGGGLRRLYDPRHEVLRGRLRGQLDRPGYLRQLAQARPDRVPCRFSVHDTDNLPNRALRWGLHLCLGLLTQVRVPARAKLAERIKTADARFAGAAWSRVTRSDLPQLRRPPRALKAYETSGALPLARLLIERAHLGGPKGGSASIALAFDMPALFERAFAQGLADLDGHLHDHIAQQQWRPKFEAKGKDFWRANPTVLKPDVYLPPSGGHPTLVADTKWKQVEVAQGSPAEDSRQTSPPNTDSTPASDDQCVIKNHRFKVLREDLYQILSYSLTARARHPKIDVVAILVYPTVDQADAAGLMAALKWENESSAHDWLTVKVVGWPVSGRAGFSLRNALKNLLNDLGWKDSMVGTATSSAQTPHGPDEASTTNASR